MSDENVGTKYKVTTVRAVSAPIHSRKRRSCPQKALLVILYSGRERETCLTRLRWVECINSGEIKTMHKKFFFQFASISCI